MHLLAEYETWDPFPPIRHFDDTADRRHGNRAIAVSAVGLALTGLVELAIAVLSGSVGLLGDALHNLSDVSTSAVVFVGFRVSKRPATPRFPYGYEWAEDLAGLGVALVVWASALFAGVVSVHKLTEHGRTTNLGLGMAAAVVGIMGNQVVAATSGASGGASSPPPCSPTPSTRGSTPWHRPARCSGSSVWPPVIRGPMASPG